MMEVRCCCDPDRLIGTIDIPEPYGKAVMFLLDPPRRGWCETLWNRRPDDKPETVTLEVDTIQPGSAPDNRYRCFKANEVPIETLRRVPGFREA